MAVKATYALPLTPSDRQMRRPGVLALGVFGGLAVGLLFAVIAGTTSPILGALGIVGIAGVAGMMISPTIGLMGLCFSIPIERIGNFTAEGASATVSLGRVAGIIALTGYLLHAFVRRWKLRFGPALLMYLGYAVIAAISISYSNYPDMTRRDAIRIAGNVIFFFYVINAIRSYDLAKLGVIIWLVATVGTGVYSLYDYYIGNSQLLEESEMGATENRLNSVVSDDSETRSLGMKVKRALGTTAHPTLFGLNLTMTLPFFFWLIRTQSFRWKIICLGGLLICCYNIFLSNTRAVMLLAGLTVIACGLRKIYRITPGVLCAAALAGVMILPFIPEDVYLRTLDWSMYLTTKSDSIRIRFKYWEKSYELIQDNWMTGIGVGDQTTIVNMVTDETAGRITPLGLMASAHNEYIWTLVEVGLLGWLLHFGFVFYVVRASFRSAKLWAQIEGQSEKYWLLVACQINLIGILLFGVQTEVFHFALKGWWLPAGISCALLYLAQKQIAQMERKPALVAGGSV